MRLGAEIGLQPAINEAALFVLGILQSRYIERSA
jgi:hypothetical protein